WSEVDCRRVREMQQASALATPEEVGTWRRSAPPSRHPPPSKLVPLAPARRDAERSLGDTIQHRGSSRQFTRAALTAAELATTLWWSTRPIAADVPPGLTGAFVIVNAGEGPVAGAYRYWRQEHALELVRAGELRRESAYLCLEQPLGGDAAAVLYFLTPLDALLRMYGNRG